MDKVEIYEWLKSQKYQTGYDEVGEYVMYYSVDMPRILEDYYEYKVKKLNKPAVIHSGNWKCLLCGRDKFTHKTPHKCVGGYRKRNIIWQKLS